MNSVMMAVTCRSAPKRKPSFSRCLKISTEIRQMFAPMTPARSSTVRGVFLLRQRVLMSPIDGRVLRIAMPVPPVS